MMATMIAMTARRPEIWWMVLLAGTLLAAGCASAQKSPPPPLIYSVAMYPVTDYPIHTETEGIQMAVTAWAPGRDLYADPKGPLVSTLTPDATPGLNVLEAGVLPLRVIIQNQSRSIVVIDPSQSALVSGRVAYRPHTAQEAAEVVIQSAAFGQAIKGTGVGPMTRSILGGEVLLKTVTGALSGVLSGGLAGATSGATTGAGSALAPAQRYQKELAEMIRHVYTTRALAPARLLPGYMMEGLLFFPSDVNAETLKILAYDESRGRPVTLTVPFPTPGRQP